MVTPGSLSEPALFAKRCLGLYIMTKVCPGGRGANRLPRWSARCATDNHLVGYILNNISLVTFEPKHKRQSAQT